MITYVFVMSLLSCAPFASLPSSISALRVLVLSYYKYRSALQIPNSLGEIFSMRFSKWDSYYLLWEKLVEYASLIVFRVSRNNKNLFQIIACETIVTKIYTF